MKEIKNVFLLVCLFPILLFSQTTNFRFEKAESFLPGDLALKTENIEWGYLIVPENWNDNSEKKIKIAVAVLKRGEITSNSEPLVFIQGGPGSAGIQSGIGRWLHHPLRKTSDIVLIDVRGTGFSLPKFCPDLGKTFMEILAKNNSKTEDEQQKVFAAMACREQLVNNNINIHAYNSKAIAKDLNALKTALSYNQWNVYGVSYGTYMAKVYATAFPNDVKSLILDSPISNISEYYTLNTSHYINSLERVFNACKNDPIANTSYPNLEQVYYETIEKLEKNPITVKVSKSLVSTGEFTFNAEDFKVAIQQALYNRSMIEVLPLLITEFNKGNKDMLGSLVQAFSGPLQLDYGMYYCVTCDEVIPFNSLSEFENDSKKYEKLNGGLSFYKSDFLVCDKWNKNWNKSFENDSIDNISTLSFPVLVFSGGFDPITPGDNGKTITDKCKNAYWINPPTSGHASGLSRIGSVITAEFVNNPTQRPKSDTFAKKIDFITNVKINGGVSNLAKSLGEFNYLFFAPVLIAVVVLLSSIFGFIYLIIKNRKSGLSNIIVRSLIVFTSLIGLYTLIELITVINNTAEINYFILAFGVPNQFSYLFILQRVFMVMTGLSFIYFIVKIKTIRNATIVFSALFSIIVLATYYQYWGFHLFK